MWPEVAGNEAGDELRRRRVWDLDGNGATELGGARARVRCAPGGTRSTVLCSGERDSGYGDGHELIGGEVFGRGKSGGCDYGERPERGGGDAAAHREPVGVR